EGTHPAFYALNERLKGDGKSTAFELHLANALWAQKGFPFQKRFLQLTLNYHAAGLKEVEFSNNPDEACRIINEWVEKETKRRIQELFNSSDLTPNTRL